MSIEDYTGIYFPYGEHGIGIRSIDLIPSDRDSSSQIFPFKTTHDSYVTT